MCLCVSHKRTRVAHRRGGRRHYNRCTRKICLKLDFVNAFNEVERGAVIDEVRATFPELSPHVGVRYALGPARHDGHLRG